eukprot:CAMPEP_0171874616 /NCGR_PEP_ID=MMETSP0992-20121227/35078_1 /TAXON_ID=483369 /ORGANISM="non described non described, Strain CCMP2098" /LENGTH=51 /DNA_ID=CAMNT_0012499451 /DNA_START=524 /DNA_END=679 /DNA_ORIENTATION=+
MEKQAPIAPNEPPCNFSSTQRRGLPEHSELQATVTQARAVRLRSDDMAYTP